MNNEYPAQYPNGNGVTAKGVRIVRNGNEELVCIDDLRDVIIREINGLPKLANPSVQAAQDARKIISELTEGIGGDMEQFESDAKKHVTTIRGTRMTVVAEISQMLGALKDVRQFFLGSDYVEEMRRLSEFVEICERLQRLKDSGFLDKIADTMLSLAEGKQAEALL